MIALRIRPVAGGLPSPRIVPPEGTMIAGRFIAGNVILLLQILSDDPRQLLVYRYGHFCMMIDFFLIQKPLFLNDGLSLNAGKKLVSRKLLSHFSMVEGIVLEDRKPFVVKRLIIDLH